MAPAEAREDAAEADVCLVLEGTYPYVKGGVSTWAHRLIASLPERRFSIVHLGPEPGTYARRVYALPANVVGMCDLYCREPLVRDPDLAAMERSARAAHRRFGQVRQASRFLDGIRRLHLEEGAIESVLDDLASADLSVDALLHGRASFELTMELYERLAPDASFLHFFWHFRSMHLPLVRLLAGEPPGAAVYHSLCTGYAGLLGAVWSRRTGRPFLLTEHGIYLRERKFELDRATWLNEAGGQSRSKTSGPPIDPATVTALRRMWAGFFRVLARCAYAQASSIVSLCEASRARQIADGAMPERTLVISNGIDTGRFNAPAAETHTTAAARRPFRVGFVGRVVPIKDLVTFIRACQLALQEADIEVRIFGPDDEDRRYARRCRSLVSKLGLGREIRFEASRPAEQIYSEIDVLVLTSFSEGQPLVALEAGAAGLPVIASDVGACRELLEGRGEADRRIGPSGIVTRLAAPDETAAAIVRLAHEPELRRRMGAAGRRRVATHYRESATIGQYRSLYQEEPWPASVGASSA